MENAERQIRILKAEVARKIAAGEVIDRPNAIVRELLDNAVDSGATRIDVEISGGGIEKIRVLDNGSGITKENLLAAAHPHATSKITSEDDLLNLSTLGFRGEALASIAAVSRLSIASKGWKMRCSITEDHILEPTQETEGTIVTSENLFENFPARRQFLKRPASETKMCRTTFIEKALPRPDIAFRLTVDGTIRSDLPIQQSLKARFVNALDIRQSASLFYEISGRSQGGSAASVQQSQGIQRGGDWSFTLVIGDPSVSRPDRKDIYIYVNGRRIVEYSLMQAIEYGAQGYFPNGTHPAAALFVQMRSDLVDFNIHPAKREARFKDIAPLHHAISSALKQFFHNYTIKTMKENLLCQSPQAEEEQPQERAQSRDLGFSIDALTEAAINTDAKPDKEVYAHENKSDAFGYSIGARDVFASGGYQNPKNIPSARFGQSQYRNNFQSDFERPANLRVASSSAAAKSEVYGTDEDTINQAGSDATSGTFFPKAQSEGIQFRYIGRTLGTFIIIEKNDALYMIDQHAAHERFLFDKIMGRQNERQNLLVPQKIQVDTDEEDEQMKALASRLDEFGFACKKCADGGWEFTTTNALWKGGIDELKSLVLEQGVEPSEVIRKVAAMIACKAAVKDGYILDDAAASDLAKTALELDDPHCPHGRPVYTTISRSQLFALVKRT